MSSSAGAPPTEAGTRRATTVLLAVCLPLSLAVGWLMAGVVARQVPPLAAAFGRTAASVPFLLLVLAAKPSYRAGARATLRRGRAVTSLAVTGFFLYYVGTFVSIELAGPVLTGLVVSLMPGMTFVLGVVAFGAAANWRRGAGTVVAAAAVVAYTLSAQGTPGSAGAGAGGSRGQR